MSTISVFCAVSLDGYIAGEGDALDWLGEPDFHATGDAGTVDFATFLGQTGAMIMGRRTYEVVSGFEGPWPYGELPILVATRRPLEGAPPSVQAAAGDIASLCAQARALAGDKRVYLDGGHIISQALDAGLVEELILTVVPTLLGGGIALYQGGQRHAFSVVHQGRFGEMVQLRLTPPGA